MSADEPLREILILNELALVREGAILLSHKRNRKYGNRQVIQVSVPGEMLTVEGLFTRHEDMSEYLPATLVYEGETDHQSTEEGVE